MSAVGQYSRIPLQDVEHIVVLQNQGVRHQSVWVSQNAPRPCKLYSTWQDIYIKVAHPTQVQDRVLWHACCRSIVNQAPIFLHSMLTQSSTHMINE